MSKIQSPTSSTPQVHTVPLPPEMEAAAGSASSAPKKEAGASSQEPVDSKEAWGLGGAHDFLNSVVGGVKAKVQDTVQSTLDGAKEVVKDAKETVEDAVHSTLDGAKEVVKDAKEVVEDAKEVVEDAKEVVEETAQSTLDGAKELAKDAKEVINDNKEFIEQAAKFVAKSKDVIGLLTNPVGTIAKKGSELALEALSVPTQTAQVNKLTEEVRTVTVDLLKKESVALGKTINSSERIFEEIEGKCATKELMAQKLRAHGVSQKDSEAIAEKFFGKEDEKDLVTRRGMAIGIFDSALHRTRDDLGKTIDKINSGDLNTFRKELLYPMFHEPGLKEFRDKVISLVSKSGEEDATSLLLENSVKGSRNFVDTWITRPLSSIFVQSPVEDGGGLTTRLNAQANKLDAREQKAAEPLLNHIKYLDNSILIGHLESPIASTLKAELNQKMDKMDTKEWNETFVLVRSENYAALEAQIAETLTKRGDIKDPVQISALASTLAKHMVDRAQGELEGRVEKHFVTSIEATRSRMIEPLRASDNARERALVTVFQTFPDSAEARVDALMKLGLRHEHATKVQSAMVEEIKRSGGEIEKLSLTQSSNLFKAGLDDTSESMRKMASRKLDNVFSDPEIAGLVKRSLANVQDPVVRQSMQELVDRGAGQEKDTKDRHDAIKFALGIVVTLATAGAASSLGVLGVGAMNLSMAAPKFLVDQAVQDAATKRSEALPHAGITSYEDAALKRKISSQDTALRCVETLIGAGFAMGKTGVALKSVKGDVPIDWREGAYSFRAAIKTVIKTTTEISSEEKGKDVWKKIKGAFQDEVNNPLKKEADEANKDLEKRSMQSFQTHIPMK